MKKIMEKKMRKVKKQKKQRMREEMRRRLQQYSDKPEKRIKFLQRLLDEEREDEH